MNGLRRNDAAQGLEAGTQTIYAANLIVAQGTDAGAHLIHLKDTARWHKKGPTLIGTRYKNLATINI